MLKLVKDADRLAGRFLLALPLIAALPLVAEAVQHLVEYRAGMFTSMAGMEAAGDDPGRAVTGYIKIATLFLVNFWALRFAVFGGDRVRTTRFDARAWTLYAFVLAFGFATTVAHSVAGPALAQLFTGTALIAAGFAAFFLAIAAELYLAVWRTGAALGNPHLHPLASIRLMNGNLMWSFGFTMAVMMPAMVLHYGLNALAVGQAPSLQIAILGLDCLLVAYMAALLPIGATLIARRAAERAGVSLLPREAVAFAA